MARDSARAAQGQWWSIVGATREQRTGSAMAACGPWEEAIFWTRMLTAEDMAAQSRCFQQEEGWEEATSERSPGRGCSGSGRSNLDAKKDNKIIVDMTNERALD